MSARLPTDNWPNFFLLFLFFFRLLFRLLTSHRQTGASNQKGPVISLRRPHIHTVFSIIVRAHFCFFTHLKQASVLCCARVQDFRGKVVTTVSPVVGNGPAAYAYWLTARATTPPESLPLPFTIQCTIHLTLV